MAKYFDRREGREKTVPNCAKHGLVWNPQSQRCEKITGLGFLMAEDFYIDDYGGGSFYNGGGPDVFLNGGGGFDFGAGDDFYYGYGFDQPTTEPPLDPVADQFFMGDDFNYGYGFDQPFNEGFFDPGGGDPFLAYLDHYINLGIDENEAVDLATQALASEGGVFQIGSDPPSTPEPVVLPDIRPFELPYIPTPFDPFQFQPPEIPFVPFPLPFIPEPIPAPSGVRLPPACAGGTYHPYPIGHPQQDICVPFPPAPPQQQQRPPQQQGQQQTPKPPVPKPPAQQQTCPATQCRHPQTGQCMPIPQGYARHPQTQVCVPRCGAGTVYDQATGRCVPTGQAISPLPSEVEDTFTDLKNLPWWAWAGLAGVVVLTQRGGR